MAPVIVTLVRHGESQDNLTALWAGQRDAPLTNHGMAQAERLGQAFKDVPITAIYASDLKRANTTARKIWEANTTVPKPPFTTSPLLREQFFGEAEGEPWNAGKFDSSHLPWEEHRAFHIAPNAESLNEVGHRASLVLRHFLLPHVLATASLPPSAASPPEQHHIVLVAHGIWLSEMLFALKRAGEPGVRYVKQGGYANTAWSRVEVELDDLSALEGEGVGNALEQGEKGANGAVQPAKDEKITSPPAPSEAAPSTSSSSPPTTSSSADHTTSSSTSSTTPRPPLPPHLASLLPTLPALPPRDPLLPPPFPLSTTSPPAHPSPPVPRLRHRLVAFNQKEHLEGLKRTGRGVGSAGWDEKQRGLKEFFGGGGGGGGEKGGKEGKKEEEVVKE